jgi:hypothetical protein
VRREKGKASLVFHLSFSDGRVVHA